MTQLFDRRCVVLVGREQKAGDFSLVLPSTLRLEGLRTTFSIKRDTSATPNVAELSIFNLSPASRSELQGKGFRLVLLAGYSTDVAQIFSGEVSRFVHEKAGPDMVTKINAGDGARAFQHARVSESYRAGTPVSQVVARTVQALQLDPGNAVATAKRLAGEFSAGYVQHGPAAEELSRLLEPRGLEWSVQDGRLELLPAGGTLPETGPLLSPDTGLVGAPQLGSPAEKGKPSFLKVRSLLQPGIRPGQRFQLESSTQAGTFRAVKVTHSGDTHGGDWYTDVEALPL